MRNAYINFSDEEIDNLDYDLVKLIFEDSQVFSDVEKEQLILERAKKIKTSASVGQLEEFLSGFREATENSIYNKDFPRWFKCSRNAGFSLQLDSISARL